MNHKIRDTLEMFEDPEEHGSECNLWVNKVTTRAPARCQEQREGQTEGEKKHIFVVWQCFDETYGGKYFPKDRQQRATHSTKSDLKTQDGWLLALMSFQALMTDICFISLQWALLRRRSSTSSNLEPFVVICCPSGRKHHLFFAMLRWILLPLAVAMSDDAECDSPGMIQVKGFPSRQRTQPTNQWAPRFETSDNETNETSTLEMDCQGVAWFTWCVWFEVVLNHRHHQPWGLDGEHQKHLHICKDFPG